MTFPSYSKNGKYIKANLVPQKIRDLTVYEINRTTKDHGYKAWFSEKYVSVFNLEQVDGINHDWVKPEAVEVKENEILEEAQKIIENMPQRPELIVLKCLLEITLKVQKNIIAQCFMSLLIQLDMNQD